MDTRSSARLLAYAVAIGLASALFALALYIPASGLIELLRPFVGLKLIAYCVELYFGGVLIFAAYVFRRQINVLIVFLGVSVFCITNGAEGVFSSIAPAALQREFSWTYVALYGLGGVAFLVALIVAFSTIRSGGGKPA